MRTAPPEVLPTLSPFCVPDRGQTAGGRKPNKNHTPEKSTMPILLAAIEGNLQVAIAALGAAIAIGLVGMKAAEAVGRNPGAATPILVQAIIGMALAEGVLFITIFLGK